MSKETQLAALYGRKQKLERNGKNSEGQGVLRKINRQIRNLQKQDSQSLGENHFFGSRLFYLTFAARLWYNISCPIERK